MSIQKKIILPVFFSISLIFYFCKCNAQGTERMDATAIASNYYSGIVKILLFDSLAEKQNPGSGYLGRGSGFIATESGLIFTNKHVIDFCLGYIKYSYYNPSDKKIYDAVDNNNSSFFSDPDYLVIKYERKATPIIQVYTGKNENSYNLYFAKIIAIDTANFDGAILKIVSDINGNPVTYKFNPIPIGNSDSTKQGEDLCVYGFPAQYDANFDVMLKDQSTLTFGKHSGFDYYFNPQYGYIKTDASINSGNSGGPVFNSSNKVIGMATATGDKTNIGLIGGINAMYYLASVQPELLIELTQKGLTQPQRKPSFNTATLNTNQPLIALKLIKRSNVKKNHQRKFKGGRWYVKGLHSFYQKNEFSINASDEPVIVTNTDDNPLNVKMSSEKGWEIGRLFTLWRISNNFKLSLDWTFLNFMVSKMDWSNSSLYADTYGSNISYIPDVNVFRGGTRFGLNFSYLLLRRCVIDFYYKFSIASPSRPEIGRIENELSLSGNPAFKIASYGYIYNTFGFNIRHNFYFIGMEYSFGNNAVEYDLYYLALTGSYFDGIKNVNTYGYEYKNVYGNIKMSVLNFTIGLTFGGGNKWKKLLTKEHKKSL